MNAPQHRPLNVIVRGTFIIAVFALIIQSFLKKPTPAKTERQEDSEKRTLSRDLLHALQNLASMYGLERPDSSGDILSIDLSPCEVKDDVYIYKFTIEKDISSDKPFDTQRFTKSLIRRIKRMEREHSLITATPYGFLMNDEELSSILVMGVKDNGDYVEIRVARADEDSCRLYKSERIKSNNVSAPADPDF